MNFRQLKCFSLSAELHSFSLASERLYISQSAVTQQIKTLENEVGCQLFHRSNRGITLTAEGEKLLKAADQILQIWDNAVQQLNTRCLDENLCIGYLGPPPTDMFAWLSKQLHNQNPNLHITYTRFSPSEVVEAISSGKADLIFGENNSLWQRHGIRFVSLYQERHYLVLSADHPLANRVSLSLADMKGETFVLPSRRPWIDHLNRLCEMPGGEQLENFIPASDFLSYAPDVLAYRAVAIIPERMYPQSDQVVAIPLAPDIPFYAGFLCPRLSTERSAQIIDYCKNFIQEREAVGSPLNIHSEEPAFVS